MTQDDIVRAIKTVVDPNTGLDLVSARALKDLAVDADGTVRVSVALGYPVGSQGPILKQHIEQTLLQAGASRCVIDVHAQVVAHAVQRGLKVMPHIKNIVAVASGKGGVGKSTVAANLALALAAEGARVGVLDADIYGPSQPVMLGISGKPEVTDNKLLKPLENHGVQVASIGFLIGADQPAIWRGPMVTQALQQLLTQTDWDQLDYLVVDMPPGTGDIQLTLAQQVPVTGAVIVTTPQDIALSDAIKGFNMFKKVGIPILGIVENMAVHVCSNCGHTEHIFSAGGGQKMATQYQTELLVSLPLDIRIREQADAGVPTVVAAPDSELAQRYRSMAIKVAARIATQPKDMSIKVPVVKASAV